MSRLGFMPVNATMEALLKQSVSDNGQDIYWDGDTDAHTGQWKNFVTGSEVVVASITDNGGTPTVGITGGTIPAGMFISSAGVFTSITLTSGTVVMGRV